MVEEKERKMKLKALKAVLGNGYFLAGFFCLSCSMACFWISGNTLMFYIDIAVMILAFLLYYFKCLRLLKDEHDEGEGPNGYYYPEKTK
jgi:hypothetical protein